MSGAGCRAANRGACRRAPNRGFYLARKTAWSSRHRLPYDKVQFYFARADAHRNAAFTLQEKQPGPPDIDKDKILRTGMEPRPYGLIKSPGRAFQVKFLRKLSSRICRAAARTESRLSLCARNGLVLPTSAKINFPRTGMEPRPYGLIKSPGRVKRQVFCKLSTRK